MLAHRVAWLFEFGVLPSRNEFLLHSCHDRACVAIEHLRLGDHSENMADRAARGNYNTSRGLNNPFARFTDDEVADMRRMISDGIDHSWIATVFGCSRSYLRLIANGTLRAQPTSTPSPAALARRDQLAQAEAHRLWVSEITDVVHPDDEIDGEEWRPTAFDGYFVSSLGRVRGRTMRILTPHVTSAGYAVVHCGRGNPQGVHVLVCQAWHGTRPAPGMHAAHGDGNPLNNTPENLRWATPLENNGRDRLRHGRIPRGTAHHAAKLTPEIVRVIRSQLPGPRGTINRLAREYGVANSTITSIRDNITWRE
ncbi:HNH endonuclease [Arthrobacter sp. I2-34]|uniref:HNH endonuclease n=1 Tax=Arthrobacter hankyongi TaxID=2904801 RepID=A0ABS9LDV2_9MICC|nr:HNH endonuclease signature motif containing protein [Arthrobacter hankyongi]MCG2624693.1 HNH endonuclease [Arthrobacter hankyongi]